MMYTATKDLQYNQQSMLVAVGSTNPVKIEAVRLAFQTVWPKVHWNFIGVTVHSGVGQQPMSSEEAITGATQRAQSAQAKRSADYGVGIEGGVQSVRPYWFAQGWVVVVNRAGKQGIGSSYQVPLPPPFITRLQQGQELGEIDDAIFGTNNSKQQHGYFGLVTNGALDRTRGYRDGVIAALAPFIHPELFSPGTH